MVTDNVHSNFLSCVCK